MRVSTVDASVLTVDVLATLEEVDSKLFEIEPLVELSVSPSILATTISSSGSIFWVKGGSVLVFEGVEMVEAVSGDLELSLNAVCDVGLVTKGELESELMDVVVVVAVVESDSLSVFGIREDSSWPGVDLSSTLSVLASVAASVVPFGKDVAGTLVSVTSGCVPDVDSVFVAAPLSSRVVIPGAEEDTETVTGFVLVVVSSFGEVSVVISLVVFDVICVRSSVLPLDIESVSSVKILVV